MNTIEFRSLVLRKLDELDQLYACANAEAAFDAPAAYSKAAETVGDAAARLGFADLYRRSRDLIGVPEYADVVAFLSECLAAVPEPVEPEPVGETLTVDEVAKLLGINKRSVWRRRDDGTIPQPIKLGRSLRWPKIEFENWLARR